MSSMLQSTQICLLSGSLVLTIVLASDANAAGDAADDSPSEMLMEVGEVPMEVGEMSMEVGEVPMEVGEMPMEVGEVPMEVGEVPMEVGEVPMEVGEDLLSEYLSPQLVAMFFVIC
jgi:hypothetical protein